MNLLDISERIDQSLKDIESIRQDVLRSDFDGKEIANSHLFNAQTDLSLCSFFLEDLQFCITENDKEIILTSHNREV